MAYPEKTAHALMMLGFQPGVDFEATERGDGIALITWRVPEPHPTEQQVIDILNDVELVDGQTHSEWLEERAGPNRAKNAAARELDQNPSSNGLIKWLADELNEIRAAAQLPVKAEGQYRAALKQKIRGET